MKIRKKLEEIHQELLKAWMFERAREDSLTCVDKLGTKLLKKLEKANNGKDDDPLIADLQDLLHMDPTKKGRSLKDKVENVEHMCKALR